MNRKKIPSKDEAKKTAVMVVKKGTKLTPEELRALDEVIRAAYRQVKGTRR